MGQWTAALDAWVPASFRVSAYEQRRVRVLIGLLWLTVGINTIGGALMYLNLGWLPTHNAAIVVDVLCVGALLVLRRTGNVDAVGDFTVLLVLCGVTAMTLSAGLHLSAVAYLFPVMPLLGGYLGHRLRLLPATLAASAAVVGLTFVHLRTGTEVGVSDALVLGRSLGMIVGILYAAGGTYIFASARRMQQSEITRTARRMQTVVDNLHNGVVVTDAAGLVVTANARICEAFEIADDHVALAGRRFWDVLAEANNPPADLDELRTELLSAQSDSEGAKYRLLAEQVPLREGGVFELDYVPIALDSEAAGHLWTFKDVTSHANLAADLQSMLDVDSVTGLASRVRFDRFLRVTCGEPKATFALLYLDLDGFKAVNDTHGHDAGDQVLHTVSQRIKASVRSGDVAARLGGDEFAVCLSGVSDAQVAVTLCEKLLPKIRAPIAVDGAEVQVGASIGVAVYPQAGDTPAAIVSAADTAMYEAKRGGKNRVVLAQDAARGGRHAASGGRYFRRTGKTVRTSSGWQSVPLADDESEA